ncbi:MAG TPA: hypothetical protein VFS83_11625 [Ktedonobacterales bacterium]|nr:hypothetical protein [Ktedonobacterales bacterium]
MPSRSDVSSLPTHPPISAPRRGSRRFAGLALLIGGLLIGAASFLPWMQRTVAAVGHKPANISSHTAAQDLLSVIQQTMHAPDSAATYGNAINDGMAAFAMWGVPLLLVLFGLSVLLARVWAPRLRTRVFYLLLVVANVALTVLLVWLYSTTHVDGGAVTNTRQVGPAVALLGDFFALVGILVLARLPRIAKAPRMPKTKAPKKSRKSATVIAASTREDTAKGPVAPPPLTPPPNSRPRDLIPVEDW